jgi:methionyl-tRNA formyltransferase
MYRNIVLFGDNIGIPQLMKHLPPGVVSAIVSAEIRPQQHEFLKSFSEYHHIPLVIQPVVTSERYDEFFSQLKHIYPGLIIANSYSMIIRPDVLSLCNAVNIHGALLPQYRGANPIQWAILNNAVESGTTMHYIDAGLDTGDIIAQHRVPMFIEDTWVDIYNRTFLETDVMLIEELPKLLHNNTTRTPQDESVARYWRRRTPEDGLIDWNDSVLHIYNLIRALVKPHLGAFYINSSGDKVVIDEFKTIKQVIDLKLEHDG